jgi:hypothetical protein
VACAPPCAAIDTLPECNAAGCAWYACAEACRDAGTPLEEVCSPPATTPPPPPPPSPTSCDALAPGDNGDPCVGVTPETWRCACSAIFGRPVSQVCRDGIWQTFSTRPSDCSACAGGWDPGCG